MLTTFFIFRLPQLSLLGSSLQTGFQFPADFRKGYLNQPRLSPARAPVPAHTGPVFLIHCPQPMLACSAHLQCKKTDIFLSRVLHLHGMGDRKGSHRLCFLS